MLLYAAASDPALPVDPPLLRQGSLGLISAARLLWHDGAAPRDADLTISEGVVILPSFRESLTVDIDFG